MRWTIPNTLTVGRLLAAPLVALAFVLFPSPYADWVALALFTGAALTDYLDGFLARRWDDVSNFGRMLDPIADKAMVVIALAMIIGIWQGQVIIVVPAVVILFREVFVSGLREFLGSDASRLQVTKLAKWKTATQMFAIAVIFVSQLFQHYVGVLSYGMEQQIFESVLAGGTEDLFGLRWKYPAFVWTYNGGIILLWVAALLTFITGLDYFRKAMPFLKEGA